MKTPQHVVKRALEMWDSDEYKTKVDICSAIRKEFWYNLPRTTLVDIISREWLQTNLDNLSDSLEEKQKFDYDADGLYVYTSHTNKNWDKERVKFTLPWSLVETLQFAYVSKWKNMTGQEMVNYNWGTDEEPVYIDEKARNAFRSAANLQKASGICNKTLLKVIRDKWWVEEVQKYIEGKALVAVNDWFRQREVEALDRAKEREYNRILTSHNKVSKYLEDLSASVVSHDPKQYKIESKARKNSDVLHVVIWDPHGWKNPAQLKLSLDNILTLISSASESTISIKDVWDNLETVVAGGMHSSQNFDLRKRWFDQILETVDLFEWFLVEIYKMGKEILFHGITGNHGRGTKDPDEDIQRIPELAFYEILKSRLRELDGVSIHYHMGYVKMIEDDGFNRVLTHGDYHARQKPEQVNNYVGGDKWYYIITQGHIHTPWIEEGKWFTRLTVPSLNHWGRYEENIILKASMPGFVTIKNVSGYPLITFHKVDVVHE